MMRKLIVPFAVATILPLVGCSPSKEDKPPAPKVTASADAAAKAEMAAMKAEAPASVAVTKTMAALPKLGPAPKWEMQDLDGKKVTADELKGKVVVVDFWATWCPPCRVEIPGYVELQKKYGKDGLVIVGASIDEGGPEVVKPFAAKNGINYTMVMATEAVATAFGGVQAIPTTFLIDRNGQIRDRKEGAEETADYEKKIVSVMGEKT